MNFRIDQTRTTLGFSVKHMMVATVRGSFSQFEAELDLDPQNLPASRVTARIATSSVQTGDRLRDEYLVGAHFFHPTVHPHITFTSSGVRVSGSKLSVSGQLTIVGQTRPVTLEGKFRHSTPGSAEERLAFSLTGEVDREAFGLVFHGAVETVSVVVGKKVKLELEIEAVRA